MSSNPHFIEMNIPLEMLKDLIIVHYNALGVFKDNEDVDLVFGNSFYDDYVKGTPDPSVKFKVTEVVPVTFRVSTGEKKQEEVKQYNFQA